MSITTFIELARTGRVRITLRDGQVHTGHFRTDILSESAVSAFFFGDIRPISLGIDEVVAMVVLDARAVAA